MAELRQRAVKWTDADWQSVQKSAKAAGKTAAEWVRERASGSIDTGDLARVTAERDAALKLAKLAEENVARLEADAVRIPPVPSVDTLPSSDALSGLEKRIAERAATVGMSVSVWLRGVVEVTLGRPLPTAKTASKTVREPSTKHLERDPASRFAHLTVAPADSPNVKWKMGEEPGPPAWMTAPTTKPGMSGERVHHVSVMGVMGMWSEAGLVAASAAIATMKGKAA